MSSSVQAVRPGVFRVRVYVGVVDGKERVKSRTFEAENMRAARRMAPRFEQEIRDGVSDEVKARGTVAELVDKWAEHRKSAATTAYREASITRRIVDHLGHIQARELTGRDVEGFYAHLRTIVVAGATDTVPERCMSESTVHHHFRVLRSILRYGERHDLIDSVATARATKPKPEEFEVMLETDAVMEGLFFSAPVAIQFAVAVEALTGLRRGELFGLRWRDIRLGVAHVSNNTVVIPGQLVDTVTKGKRARSVPLVPTLQAALTEHRAAQEAEAARHGVKLASDARVMADMSLDPTGRTSHHPDWLSNAWRRHCRKAGVHVRLHDLRHWCATQLLQAGVPIRAVQKILGHADPATTMRIYAHVIEGSYDDARDALAAKSGLVALPAPPVSAAS